MQARRRWQGELLCGNKSLGSAIIRGQSRLGGEMPEVLSMSHQITQDKFRSLYLQESLVKKRKLQWRKPVVHEELNRQLCIIVGAGGRQHGHKRFDHFRTHIRAQQLVPYCVLPDGSSMLCFVEPAVVKDIVRDGLPDDVVAANGLLCFFMWRIQPSEKDGESRDATSEVTDGNSDEEAASEATTLNGETSGQRSPPSAAASAMEQTEADPDDDDDDDDDELPPPPIPAAPPEQEKSASQSKNKSQGPASEVSQAERQPLNGTSQDSESPSASTNKGSCDDQGQGPTLTIAEPDPEDKTLNLSASTVLSPGGTTPLEAYPLVLEPVPVGTVVPNDVGSTSQSQLLATANPQTSINTNQQVDTSGHSSLSGSVNATAGSSGSVTGSSADPQKLDDDKMAAESLQEASSSQDCSGRLSQSSNSPAKSHNSTESARAAPQSTDSIADRDRHTCLSTSPKESTLGEVAENLSDHVASSDPPEAVIRRPINILPVDEKLCDDRSTLLSYYQTMAAVGQDSPRQSKQAPSSTVTQPAGQQLPSAGSTSSAQSTNQFHSPPEQPCQAAPGVTSGSSHTTSTHGPSPSGTQQGKFNSLVELLSANKLTDQRKNEAHMPAAGAHNSKPSGNLHMSGSTVHTVQPGMGSPHHSPVPAMPPRTAASSSNPSPAMVSPSPNTMVPQGSSLRSSHGTMPNPGGIYIPPSARLPQPHGMVPHTANTKCGTHVRDRVHQGASTPPRMNNHSPMESLYNLTQACDSAAVPGGQSSCMYSQQPVPLTAPPGSSVMQPRLPVNPSPPLRAQTPWISPQDAHQTTQQLRQAELELQRIKQQELAQQQIQQRLREQQQRQSQQQQQMRQQQQMQQQQQQLLQQQQMQQQMEQQRIRHQMQQQMFNNPPLAAGPQGPLSQVPQYTNVGYEPAPARRPSRGRSQDRGQGKINVQLKDQISKPAPEKSHAGCMTDFASNCSEACVMTDNPEQQDASLMTESRLSANQDTQTVQPTHRDAQTAAIECRHVPTQTSVSCSTVGTQASLDSGPRGNNQFMNNISVALVLVKLQLRNAGAGTVEADEALQRIIDVLKQEDEAPETIMNIVCSLANSANSIPATKPTQATAPETTTQEAMDAAEPSQSTEPTTTPSHSKPETAPTGDTMDNTTEEAENVTAAMEKNNKDSSSGKSDRKKHKKKHNSEEDKKHRKRVRSPSGESAVPGKLQKTSDSITKVSASPKHETSESKSGKKSSEKISKSSSDSSKKSDPKRRSSLSRERSGSLKKFDSIRDSSSERTSDDSSSDVKQNKSKGSETDGLTDSQRQGKRSTVKSSKKPSSKLSQEKGDIPHDDRQHKKSHTKPTGETSASSESERITLKKSSSSSIERSGSMKAEERISKSDNAGKKKPALKSTSLPRNKLCSYEDSIQTDQKLKDKLKKRHNNNKTQSLDKRKDGREDTIRNDIKKSKSCGNLNREKEMSEEAKKKRLHFHKILPGQKQQDQEQMSPLDKLGRGPGFYKPGDRPDKGNHPGPSSLYYCNMPEPMIENVNPKQRTLGINDMEQKLASHSFSDSDLRKLNSTAAIDVSKKNDMNILSDNKINVPDLRVPTSYTGITVGRPKSRISHLKQAGVMYQPDGSSSAPGNFEQGCGISGANAPEIPQSCTKATWSSSNQCQDAVSSRLLQLSGTTTNAQPVSVSSSSTGSLMNSHSNMPRGMQPTQPISQPLNNSNDPRLMKHRRPSSETRDSSPTRTQNQMTKQSSPHSHVMKQRRPSSSETRDSSPNKTQNPSAKPSSLFHSHANHGTKPLDTPATTNSDNVADITKSSSSSSLKDSSSAVSDTRYPARYRPLSSSSPVDSGSAVADSRYRPLSLSKLSSPSQSDDDSLSPLKPCGTPQSQRKRRTSDERDRSTPSKRPCVEESSPTRASSPEQYLDLIPRYLTWNMTAPQEITTTPSGPSEFAPHSSSDQSAGNSHDVGVTSDIEPGAGDMELCSEESSCSMDQHGTESVETPDTGRDLTSCRTDMDSESSTNKQLLPRNIIKGRGLFPRIDSIPPYNASASGASRHTSDYPAAPSVSQDKDSQQAVSSVPRPVSPMTSSGLTTTAVIETTTLPVSSSSDVHPHPDSSNSSSHDAQPIPCLIGASPSYRGIGTTAPQASSTFESYLPEDSSSAQPDQSRSSMQSAQGFQVVDVGVPAPSPGSPTTTGARTTAATSIDAVQSMSSTSATCTTTNTTTTTASVDSTSIGTAPHDVHHDELYHHADPSAATSGLHAASTTTTTTTTSTTTTNTTISSVPASAIVPISSDSDPSVIPGLDLSPAMPVSTPASTGPISHGPSEELSLPEPVYDSHHTPVPSAPVPVPPSCAGGSCGGNAGSSSVASSAAASTVSCLVDSPHKRPESIATTAASSTVTLPNIDPYLLHGTVAAILTDPVFKSRMTRHSQQLGLTSAPKDTPPAIPKSPRKSTTTTALTASPVRSQHGSPHKSPVRHSGFTRIMRERSTTPARKLTLPTCDPGSKRADSPRHLKSSSRRSPDRQNRDDSRSPQRSDKRREKSNSPRRRPISPRRRSRSPRKRRSRSRQRSGSPKKGRSSPSPRRDKSSSPRRCRSPQVTRGRRSPHRSSTSPGHQRSSKEKESERECSGSRDSSRQNSKEKAPDKPTSKDRVESRSHYRDSRDRTRHRSNDRSYGKHRWEYGGKRSSRSHQQERYRRPSHDASGPSISSIKRALASKLLPMLSTQNVDKKVIKAERSRTGSKPASGTGSEPPDIRSKPSADNSNETGSEDCFIFEPPGMTPVEIVISDSDSEMDADQGTNVTEKEGNKCSGSDKECDQENLDHVEMNIEQGGDKNVETQLEQDCGKQHGNSSENSESNDKNCGEVDSEREEGSMGDDVDKDISFTDISMDSECVLTTDQDDDKTSSEVMHNSKAKSSVDQVDSKDSDNNMDTTHLKCADKSLTDVSMDNEDDFVLELNAPVCSDINSASEEENHVPATEASESSKIPVTYTASPKDSRRVVVASRVSVLAGDGTLKPLTAVDVDDRAPLVTKGFAASLQDVNALDRGPGKSSTVNTVAFHPITSYPSPERCDADTPASPLPVCGNGTEQNASLPSKESVFKMIEKIKAQVSPHTPAIESGESIKGAVYEDISPCSSDNVDNVTKGDTMSEGETPDTPKMESGVSVKSAVYEDILPCSSENVDYVTRDTVSERETPDVTGTENLALNTDGENHDIESPLSPDAVDTVSKSQIPVVAAGNSAVDKDVRSHDLQSPLSTDTGVDTASESEVPLLICVEIDKNAGYNNDLESPLSPDAGDAVFESENPAGIVENSAEISVKSSGGNSHSKAGDVTALHHQPLGGNSQDAHEIKMSSESLAESDQESTRSDVMSETSTSASRADMSTVSSDKAGHHNTVSSFAKGFAKLASMSHKSTTVVEEQSKTMVKGHASRAKQAERKSTSSSRSETCSSEKRERSSSSTSTSPFGRESKRKSASGRNDKVRSDKHSGHAAKMSSVTAVDPKRHSHGASVDSGSSKKGQMGGSHGSGAAERDLPPGVQCLSYMDPELRKLHEASCLGWKLIQEWSEQQLGSEAMKETVHRIVDDMEEKKRHLSQLQSAIDRNKYHGNMTKPQVLWLLDRFTHVCKICEVYRRISSSHFLQKYIEANRRLVHSKAATELFREEFTVNYDRMVNGIEPLKKSLADVDKWMRSKSKIASTPQWHKCCEMTCRQLEITLSEVQRLFRTTVDPARLWGIVPRPAGSTYHKGRPGHW